MSVLRGWSHLVSPVSGGVEFDTYDGECDARVQRADRLFAGD